MINQSYLLSDRVKKLAEKNGLLLIGVPLFCLLGGVGYFFYSFYARDQQERAQLAFSQTMHEIQQSHKNAELWPNAELAAKTGYRTYKSTSFGPYFLMLESQAALAQGNMQDGYKLLAEAVRQMGTSSPLYYLNAIKLALVKLDVDDITVQNEGFQELEKLAYDNNNTQRDEALYYLGDYYMNHGDTPKALHVWQELKKDFSSTQSTSASPWTLLAEDKIK